MKITSLKIDRSKGPEIISSYGVLKDRFERSLALEENKYPFTDREKIFIDTIKELLAILNYSILSKYDR